MAEGPDTRPSLLLRLRDARDDLAWREFVRLYTPLVHGFVRKQGLQDADAADLTQEVLRSVASAIGRLNYDQRLGSFRGWLFTLVRHQLSDFRDRTRRQICTTQDGSQQDQLEQCPAAADGLEAEWDREWERHLLAAAAELVKVDVQPATWSAFWRTAVDGHQPAEVAADLGMTVAAVYLARSRVMARLRQQVRAWSED